MVCVREQKIKEFDRNIKLLFVWFCYTNTTTQKGSIYTIGAWSSETVGLSRFLYLVTYSLSAVGTDNPPTVPNEQVAFLVQSASNSSSPYIKRIRSLKDWLMKYIPVFYFNNQEENAISKQEQRGKLLWIRCKGYSWS